MRRSLRTVAVMVTAFLWLNGRAGAQMDAGSLGGGATPSAVDTASVRVEGRKLFDIEGGSGLTAAERAQKVNRRLANLIAQRESVRPFNAQDLIEQKNETLITLGSEPILTVTETDAQDALMTRQELALLWGGKMATAVVDARATRANPLKGAGILIRNSFTDLLVSVVKWLPRLAGALVVLLLFWLFAGINRRLAQAATKRMHLDANLRQLICAVAFYGTWVVGLVAMLSTLGLDSSSIATGLGISGFVLGFAFKDILSHFFAGLMILLGRQFRIGDQIVVGNYEGTVERIELRALYLRTYDNRLVIIPNGDVFTSIVTSNTASPHRRREFVLGVNYSADIQAAQRVAVETMRHVEGVAEEPAPDALVDELTPGAINLRLRFYTNSQRADYLKVGSECMRRVKETFAQAGIPLPADVQTVIVQNPQEAKNLLAPPKEGTPPANRNEEAHTREGRRTAVGESV